MWILFIINVENKLKPNWLLKISIFIKFRNKLIILILVDIIKYSRPK